LFEPPSSRKDLFRKQKQRNYATVFVISRAENGISRTETGIYRTVFWNSCAESGIFRAENGISDTGIGIWRMEIVSYGMRNVKFCEENVK